MLTPNTYAKSIALKRAFESIPQPNLLVDAGCGKGFHLSQMKVNCKIGIDLNMTCFSLPSEKNIEGIKGDIQFMPFREGTIDCVMSLDSIEHVEDDKGTIAEFHRILTKRGLLILTTPTKNEFLPTPLGRLFKLDTAKFHRKWGHMHPGYDNKEILNLLKRHHFRIISHQNFRATLTGVVDALIWSPINRIYNRGKSGAEIYRQRKKGGAVTVLEKVHDFIFLHTFAYLVKYFEKRRSRDGFNHLVVAMKSTCRERKLERQQA